jgi:hypothetical protein
MPAVSAHIALLAGQRDARNCGASLRIQWAEGRADIAANLEAKPMRNSVSVRAGIRERENQNVAVK